MKKIDVIIDALSVAQNSVWSTLNQEALAYAIELKLELAKPTLPMSPEHLPQYIATNNIKPTLKGGGGAGGELAKPEQEPAAWISDSPTKGNGKQLHFTKADAWKWSSNITPLYTAPSRKEWVGLTDEEIVKILNFDNPTIKKFAYAIEAKLRERNT
jgi:hypothetical protein